MEGATGGTLPPGLTEEEAEELKLELSKVILWTVSLRSFPALWKFACVGDCICALMHWGTDFCRRIDVLSGNPFTLWTKMDSF